MNWCLGAAAKAYWPNNIFILFSYPLTLNKTSTNFFKTYSMNFYNFIYQNAFSKIYYSGDYIKSNNIDIVISNHIHSIDFLLNSIVIKEAP